MLMQAMIEFATYGSLGLGAMILWWVIYDRLLVRKYLLSEALFGVGDKASSNAPNLAVAIDVGSGMLALSLVISGVARSERLATWGQDLLAVAIQLGLMVLLLVVIRCLMAGLLRLIFRQRLDAQGSVITLDNELFEQGNVASGLFAAAGYLIVSSGMLQLHWLADWTMHLTSILNLLAVWTVGVGVLLLHSWLYLGFFTTHNLLYESFHDNNPAATCSMLGLLGGMMHIQHGLIQTLPAEQSAWAAADYWSLLGLVLAVVLIIRSLLQLIVKKVLKFNFKEALVTDHNLPWGLLDGALMLSLTLIFYALIV